MRALPPQYAMTVYYADVAGLRGPEISEITHAPVGTVMGRLHRARRKLRVPLADVADEHGYQRSAATTPPPMAVEPMPASLKRLLANGYR